MLRSRMIWSWLIPDDEHEDKWERGVFRGLTTAKSATRLFISAKIGNARLSFFWGMLRVYD